MVVMGMVRVKRSGLVKMVSPKMVHVNAPKIAKMAAINWGQRANAHLLVKLDVMQRGASVLVKRVV